MVRVEWSTEALGDLARHLDFLKERSPSAARRAGGAILAATDQLGRFPDSSRPYVPNPEHLRELLIPFGRHGYSMLYEVDSDIVRIAKLKHMREAGY